MNSIASIRDKFFSTSPDPVTAPGGEDEGPAKCWRHVGDEVLNIDEMFNVLSNRRRRLLIHFVSKNGETTLSEVAEHIAAYENEVPLGKVSSKQRKRVYVGLYQCHVDVAADAGIVKWDARSGEIEPTPLTDVVADFTESGYDSEHFSGGREAVEVRRM